ncbi:molybdate ABC transporter substrate-binding protein [Polynucleobacter sp. AP-Titi-500A-B4]|uniref:molybdate ABC transporter substrate-binding protein n=1 Tax=Polynucleobacter sp. AP-Titi-500A-B4 TaxID=2576923 RepID=UPI001BFEE77D|nr:molybdate ABC transporter substrate-binding protein [Polynucleobacter sp. AP-Titi-500A-B4]QWE13159.1 molybdate ABC transporter substrate-binding protein [Polynucleobacter sp. AP-Titi-500A-B4]
MSLRLTTLFSSLLLFANLTFAQGATVAVAANMKDAFGEIASAFKATGKAEMRVVYGSSGNFTAQIMNGAPFNLFIAADERFPLELYKNGKTMNEGSVYAIGKLALIAKTSSGIELHDSKTEISNAIMKANKIAIAKPELAPYGKAAMEYLKAEGLWDLAKDKLVYGDNIGLATTYVVTGAADIGFTALSLAKSPEVTKTTRFVLLSSKLYEPIQQRMVLIKGAPQEAQDLYLFMQGQQAKSILQKYGYTTP